VDKAVDIYRHRYFTRFAKIKYFVKYLVLIGGTLMTYKMWFSNKSRNNYFW